MDSASPASKRRWDRDLAVAVLSGFIGALALVVSTYNVVLQRQQVRAQVWPRLLFGPAFSNGSLTYALQNGGVGPAEVRTLQVLVDNKPVENWHEVILRMTGKDLQFGGYAYSTMRGSLSPVGSNRDVFTLKDESIAKPMFFQQRRLRAEICYCSALDECWVLDAENVPHSVARCPKYATPFTD